MPISEAQSLPGHLVDKGSGDPGGPVDPHIAVTDIIAVDDNHIGLLRTLEQRDEQGDNGKSDKLHLHTRFWEELPREHEQESQPF